MPQNPTRKLEAIMFTDMVGYTKLMQKDEAKAKWLRDRHRNVINTEVTSFEEKSCSIMVMEPCACSIAPLKPLAVLFKYRPNYRRSQKYH